MAKARGKVEFNQDGCKGCGLCANACPVGIIALDEEKINAKGYHPAAIKEMDKCIACTNCATMCPDTVITITRITEE